MVNMEAMNGGINSNTSLHFFGGRPRSLARFKGAEESVHTYSERPDFMYESFMSSLQRLPPIVQALNSSPPSTMSAPAPTRVGRLVQLEGPALRHRERDAAVLRGGRPSTLGFQLPHYEFGLR